MDKQKGQERPFDKGAYDKEYHKKHYKQMGTVFTIDEGSIVEAAAEAAGVTRSAYIKRAVLAYIEETNGQTWVNMIQGKARKDKGE